MKFIFKSLVIKRTLYLLLFFIVFSFAHPYYLGVCELKYNIKSETVQASVKLFVNDLEATLKKKNHSTIDLINIKDSTKKTLSLLEEVEPGCTLAMPLLEGVLKASAASTPE